MKSSRKTTNRNRNQRERRNMVKKREETSNPQKSPPTLK
jgi:hypothetical protein